MQNLKFKQLQQIYGMMNHLLWQIEPSDHYNYIPGTGWDYFGTELSKIEEATQSAFLGDRETLDRLEQIIKQLHTFVRSYSVPGVARRWLEINPKLNYFDVVYDAIENESETYLEVKRKWEAGESHIGFSFYPTLEESLERKLYFSSVREENNRLNFRFSEDRLFQNEVVKTLELVMLHDFSELQSSEKEQTTMPCVKWEYV